MYRLAFTTLACPDWSWKETVFRAAEYGYQGLELRGVEGEMDLTKASPFRDGNAPATRRVLEDRGLSVACLGSSARFDDASALRKNLDEGRRYIDLAAELEAPYVRVFGDRVPEGSSEGEVVERVAGGLSELARHAEGTEVRVLIETHGDFSRSELLARALRLVEPPKAGVLWDIHHPYRFFGEPVAETFERIGARVEHVHFKDSVPENGGCAYRPLGKGDVPAGEVIGLLKESGYKGWISLEWEKRWHPELEDPELALPAFVQTFRRIESEIDA